MKSFLSIKFYVIIFLSLIISQFCQGQYYTYVDPVSRSLNMTTAKVGSLPGSINVNSLGSATYEIPIFVSPGTAGMQPNISVVYNNMIDDGILGKGWDISGLSEIRRVSQNFYFENNVTGVTLQNTDRFALDSNRLILTSQHQYGANESEYATEIQTFVKVIAHGTAGTGPSWFEVKTKDGKTIEYGNTADSKVEALGSSTIYMWRINKVTDQNNNSMEFEYYEVTGESYIKQINYTKNIPAGLTTAYNSLKFIYYSSSRTDINTSYVAGCPIPRTKLLSSIRMETEGGSLVQEYQFKYVLDTYTHLNQITEFGSDGTYFNSTVFGWGTNASQSFTSNDAFNNSIKDKFYFGDFNGDGRTDFVSTENKTAFTTSDTWKLYFANFSGTGFNFVNEGFLDASFKGFVVADVNGNGSDDVFWRTRETIYYQCNPHLCEGGIESIPRSREVQINLVLPPPQDTCWDVCSYQQEVFRYYYNNGTTGLVRGNSSNDLVLQNAPADISLMPIELDGNGKVDYIALTYNKNIYSIIGVTCIGYPFFDSPNDIRILDFDGNGKKDLLVIKGNNSNIYQYNLTTFGLSTLYSSTSYPTINDRIFLGDFNGDKKTDILSWKSNAWSFKISSGTGFVASTAPSLITVDPNLSTADNNYYVGDFNGDKKDDVLEVYKQSPNSRLKVFFSKGCGVWDSEINTYSKASINQDFINLGDYNGDGQRDVFYYDYNLTTNFANICFFHKDEFKHIIKNIANGLNFRSTLIYRRINEDSDTSFYKKGNNATFPVYDFKGPFYVVSTLYNDNGIGGYSTKTYLYEGVKLHRQGKGLLGYNKFSQTDPSRDRRSIYTFEFNTTYFNLSLKKTEDWRTTVTNKYAEDIYTNSLKINTQNSKIIFPYVSYSTEQDYILSKTTNNTFSFDDYGNILTKSTTYYNDEPGGGLDATELITNQYGTYGNYGVPNKIVRLTTKSTYSQDSSYTRMIDYTYNSLGNLLTEKTDPLKIKNVTKTYSQFNNFGLPTKIQIAGSDIDSVRSTLFEYDSKARFIIRTTNARTQESSATYSVGTGNILTKTGIDNKIESFEYDGLGRVKRNTTITANVIDKLYVWVQNGGNSIYYISVIASGQPSIYTYYDVLSREVKTDKDGQFGTIHLQKEYNSSGLIARVTKPFLDEDPNELRWINYKYDWLGRLDTIDDNGLIFQYTYYYKTSGIVNPSGQTKSTFVNSLGKVMTVYENDGTTINYSYRSNGKVKQVTTAGTTISTTFNEYGQPVTINNPNSGITAYSYNSLGELISQTNANNKTYNYTYDVLGRQIKQIGPDTTYYDYINTGNGIGQIRQTTKPNLSNQLFSYDQYGRVTQVTNAINNDLSFTSNYTYDSWGNQTSIIYPSGYVLNYQYTNGYLSEIKNYNNTKTIWKIEDSNAEGWPLQFALKYSNNNLKTIFEYDSIGYIALKKTGNWQQNYIFDPSTGNMLSRGYKLDGSGSGLLEEFQYDNMNRLVSDTVFGHPKILLSYASNGNITSKSDAGTYTYDNGKKNAVITITGVQNPIPNPESIIYTGFNMASNITSGTENLQIYYGPANQRIKAVFKTNGTINKTKYYDVNFEKEITTSTREIHYISSPYGLIGIMIRQNGIDSLYYVETDNLGSIIGLLRPQGTSYKERYSFDPWGKRRNPTDWSYSNVSEPTVLERGFTGHEHLDKFSLINMNGRMYDPFIGRFLGVDPIIQSGDNVNSYNGYAYCLNNPLIFTDPSGYTASNDDEYYQLPEYDGYGVKSLNLALRLIQARHHGVYDSEFEMMEAMIYEMDLSSVYIGRWWEGFLGGTDKKEENKQKDNSKDKTKEKSGTIISLINGSFVRGLGVMIDIGVVEDKNGKAKTYITFGLCIGWGKSIGTGVAGSKKVDIKDFFGFSQGLNGTIPLFNGLIGAEVFGDNVNGTEGNTYLGTNYIGIGGNLGKGKSYYWYGSFTAEIYPVDNDFWIRPLRR